MAQPAADTHTKCVNHGDWSDLPTDILVLIFNRLQRTGDRIRFDAVCPPWGSAAVEARQQTINPQSPLFLLPGDRYYQVYKQLSRLNDGFSTYKAYNKKDRFRWCAHSSNVWLAKIESTPPYQIKLWNASATVRIPLATPLPPEETGAPIIYKAIASSPPLNSNCIIMMIYSDMGKLAFYKLEKKNMWKTIRSEENNYKDIMYYKGDFYAVGKLGNIVLYDMGPVPKVIDVAPGVGPWFLERKYLVESSGDLFKVLKFFDGEDSSHEEDVSTR